MAALMWQFKCNQCQSEFEQPVPQGPEEERNIKYTNCGSKDIKNLCLCCPEASACGG